MALKGKRNYFQGREEGVYEGECYLRWASRTEYNIKVWDVVANEKGILSFHLVQGK